MQAWILFIYFLTFGACKGLVFNVSRGAQNMGWQDLFSNLDPSAKCPNKSPFPDAGRPWCQARKGSCSSQGCCICKCEYPSATFRMNVNPYQATCVSNSDIRLFSGCTQLFAAEAKANPLATLDLSVKGSRGIPYIPKNYKCDVKSVEYLDIVTWKQLPKKDEDTFSIARNWSTWYKNELRWTGAMTSSYFGYIMKMNGDCKKGRDVKSGCIVFKTKGILSWTVPNPTDQVPPVTTTLPTTTKTPTTASTRKVTTQVESTTQVRLTTRKTSTATSLSSTLGSTSTVTDAMSSSKTPSSMRTTTERASSPSLTSQKTSYSTSQVVTERSTESSLTTEGALPTESTAGDVTPIEPTSRSVGSREPNKNGNKLSGEKDEEDSMMVAIVAGVAAVICVAVVVLSVWLIISWRRKHTRHGASYGAGTTVIANPTTSSQNHFPMPGLLKNPVCDDSVYAEPVDRVHKSAVSLLGNPSYETYDDLLLKNPGARDSRSIPLNNMQKKPLNTANRHTRANENTYDCTDMRTKHGGKPEGEKSIYQSLVTEEARARFKPEVNVATYQSLNPDGLMYQPLMLNKRQDEAPAYLALLNHRDGTGNIYANTHEYQPPYSTGPPPADVEESPEYADYADLDELEEISANEASNRTSDQEPSYSAPLYNVLEGPSYDYACAPMYDVLEGPDPYSVGSTNLVFEQPMYEVLEGPDTN